MFGCAPGSFMHDLNDSLQQAYEVAFGYNRVDRDETHKELQLLMARRYKSPLVRERTYCLTA